MGARRRTSCEGSRETHAEVHFRCGGCVSSLVWRVVVEYVCEILQCSSNSSSE